MFQLCVPTTHIRAHKFTHGLSLSLAFSAHSTSGFSRLLGMYACLCAGLCAATPGQGIFLLSIRHWFPVWLHQTNTPSTLVPSLSFSLCLSLTLTHKHTRTHTDARMPAVPPSNQSRQLVFGSMGSMSRLQHWKWKIDHSEKLNIWLIDGRRGQTYIYISVVLLSL